MTLLDRTITRTIECLLHTPKARVATSFISPQFVVRATRKQYKGKFDRYSVDIILTLGRPNHDARQVIAAAKKAKESFPLKRVQLVISKTA